MVLRVPNQDENKPETARRFVRQLWPQRREILAGPRLSYPHAGGDSAAF